MQDLWTLKYRAGTLEEMLGNEHASRPRFPNLQSQGPCPTSFYTGLKIPEKRLLLLPLPGNSMAVHGKTILHTSMLRIFLTRENVILSGISVLCVFWVPTTLRKSIKV